MFIIPYYIEDPVESKATFKMWKAWVFLANGGTMIWETDGPCTADEAIANYLQPNGFVGNTRYHKKTDCLYMNIKGMDFSDVYTWTEFLKEDTDIPNEFILRPFVWVGESPGLVDDWGWREQCEKVSLGKFGNLATLWDRIRTP